MTAEPNEHRPWEELAAAHALHALDPSDELRLHAHLDDCAECRSQLDEFALVAAQLGSLADNADEPPSWSQLRTKLDITVAPAADHQLAPAGSIATVEHLATRRRSTRRMLATAAAVAAIGAAVAVGTQLTSRQPTSVAAALTACRQQTGCQVIQMHGSSGDNAAVLVDAGRASIVPIKMPAAPSGRMYVLWQLPRDGSPIPVVTFNDGGRQTSSVPLMTGYADTAAFAVSLETAGPMPTRPTDVLAVGAATS